MILQNNYASEFWSVTIQNVARYRIFWNCVKEDSG